jgi:hypothetical protein
VWVVQTGLYAAGTLLQLSRCPHTPLEDSAWQGFSGCPRALIELRNSARGASLLMSEMRLWRQSSWKGSPTDMREPRAKPVPAADVGPNKTGKQSAPNKTRLVRCQGFQKCLKPFCSEQNRFGIKRSVFEIPSRTTGTLELGNRPKGA